jgi:hypothetical protein
VYNNVRAKVIRWNSVISGDVFWKGMESANNYATKWPILPFDVSRDFIISNFHGKQEIIQLGQIRNDKIIMM